MSLYSFDASSIIDLWDNYPINNPTFNAVWNEFHARVEQKKFVISDIALKEIKAKLLSGSPLATTPKSELFVAILNDIQVYEKETSDIETVKKIKKLLNIKEDNYAGGVGENDLFIIANAKRNHHILVSNEKKQPNLPKNKANYTIPTVCNLDKVGVKNINLTGLLHIDELWQ